MHTSSVIGGKMAAAILLASIRVFNHNRFVADLITTGDNSRITFTIR